MNLEMDCAFSTEEDVQPELLKHPGRVFSSSGRLPPQLGPHCRRPLGHQQVDNVQRREDVEQGDEDHDRRSPAL
jgi:hypothetical protein